MTDYSELIARLIGPVAADVEAALREQAVALRKYGSHIDDCPRNLSQPNCDWELGCTCGFDAALTITEAPG